MKKILFTTLLVLFPLSAHAAILRVGQGETYSTIQACANVANPGDTCLVYTAALGVYDEVVTPPNSGTAGNPITFQGVNSESIVKRFSLVNVNYINIEGFTITHNGMSAEAGQPPSIYLDPSSNDIIENNTITDTAGACIFAQYAISPEPSNNNLIEGNTISHCGADGGTGWVAQMGIGMFGSNNLVENNDESHIGEDFTRMLGGNDNIFRDNNWHDNLDADGQVGDAAHIDALQQYCSTSTVGMTTYRGVAIHNLLIEGNSISNNTDSNTHDFIFQDHDACGSEGIIIRYNTMYNIGSYALANNQNVGNVRFYNNTVVRGLQANPTGHGDVACQGGAYGCQLINNIYEDTVYQTSTSTGAYEDEVDPTAFVGEYQNYNLLFGTYCTTSCNWGTAGGGYRSLPNNESQSLINEDPQFVNPVARNFNIQITSPAKGLGGPLTYMNNDSGSGTTLNVLNAGMFQDGYGISGVQPDCIAVGSTTAQITCIVSVSTSTETLTVSPSISYAANAPIYLYSDSTGTQRLFKFVDFFGKLADIGAYPYSGPPVVINVLNAVIQGASNLINAIIN